MKVNRVGKEKLSITQNGAFPETLPLFVFISLQKNYKKEEETFCREAFSLPT